MVIWLVILGIVGFAVAGAFAGFRGRLAYKLQMGGVLVAGCSFALAALVLAFQEPWTPTLILDKSQRFHGSTALIALIVQGVICAGPQLTALALAGVAYFMLRFAWMMCT